MHILLAILKVIGIILLVLAGLILLILALILFVPIRYMADVNFVEKANGRAQVTWLMHLLTARLLISDNQVSYTVRICGRKLNQNKDGPEAQEKKAEKKARRQPAEKKARRSQKKEPELIEIMPEHVKTVKLKNVPADPVEEEKSEPVKPLKVAPEPAKSAPPQPEAEAGQSFRERIKATWERIKAAGEKIKNIKYTLKSFYDRIDKTKERLTRTWEKLHEAENQASIQLVKKELLKVWKQIKPRRIRGELIFGTDDPAITGQILAVCAILYPVYQDNLKIVPDFENSRLEGSLYVKGRIRIFPLLISGFKLYHDKNITRLYRNLRR